MNSMSKTCWRIESGLQSDFFFIEGSDDKRFVDTVIGPLVRQKYSFVKPYEYSRKPTKAVKSLLRSLHAMNQTEYFYLRDINDTPCITARIAKIRGKYGDSIKPGCLIIVVREIESWYLAGLDSQACREFGIEDFSNTDDITKEGFNKLIPKRFGSRIDFMIEVLKRFSVDTAKSKNKSFDYFMAKILTDLQTEDKSE